MLGHRQWLADAAGDAAGLVGRRHELRLLRQAVTLRRPVFLLGPPGVSKTSIRAAIDLASLLAGQAGVLRGGADPDLLRCLVCAAFTGRVRVRPAVSRSACDLVMGLFSGLVSQTPGGLEVLLAEAGAAAPGPAPDDAGEAEAGPGQDGLSQGGRDPRSRTDREELPGLERPGDTRRHRGAGPREHGLRALRYPGRGTAPPGRPSGIRRSFCAGSGVVGRPGQGHDHTLTAS